MVIAIILLVVIVLIYVATKNKKKESVQSVPPPIQQSPQQPTSNVPDSPNVDELNRDLNKLFESSMNKFLFKKNIIPLLGVGVQHHYNDCKTYPQDFVCGYLEREPNNKTDKKAIRFADVEGNTIAYIPKDETEFIYSKLGDDFKPIEFFGKIVWNPEGKNIAIIRGFTYESLSETKKGVMKPLSDFIVDFPQQDFSYYNY